MRMTKPRRAALLAVLALAAGVFAGSAPASPANAAIDHCGVVGSLHDGAHTPRSVSIYGAQANISRHGSEDICGTSDTTSKGVTIAWAMVAALAAPGTQPLNEMWAQAGYGLFGGQSGNVLGGAGPQGIGTFAQYTLKCKATNTCIDTSFSTVINGTNPTTGTFQFYDAYRNPSTGKLTMRVNGVNLLVSGYDPFGDWDSYWDAEYMGETKYPEDDIMGNAANLNDAAPAGTGVTFVGIKTHNNTGFVSYRDFLGGVLTAGAPTAYKQKLFGGGASPYTLNIGTDYVNPPCTSSGRC